MMDRRDFLKATGIGLTGMMLPSGFLQGMGAGSNKDRRPNVILIIADDQGFADIGCKKSASDVVTPNLDRLAARSVSFSNAYATSPVCSPSRAGLMTGCYQQRYGTYWFGGRGMYDARYKTLAEVMKSAGYKTGYLGKFHYGSENVHVPGQRSFPLNHGYEYLYGFSGGRKHYLVHNKEIQAAHFEEVKKYSTWGESLMMDAFWVNDKKVNQTGFSTQLLGDQAKNFIQNNKNEKFFLTLSFNAVHNFAHQLPEEYLKEHHLSGYHDWIPSKEDYYEWYKKGRNPNDPEGRKYYLGQLYYLDKEVGKLLDYLEQNDLDKNTLIVYVSDNGGSVTDFADNTPLRGGKYTLYEGGIRVHLMFSYGKKLLKNVTLPNMVSAMDIYPTICRLIGEQIPETVEGVDLTPALKSGSTTCAHESLVWDCKTQTAVRKGNWKLRTANSDKNAKQELMELELGEYLYDLDSDPGEKKNIIKEFPEKANELRDIYGSWKKSIDASGNN